LEPSIGHPGRYAASQADPQISSIAPHDIVEGLRITVYSQLAHTGRVEDTALVTDDAGKANPANLAAPGAGADIR
jgi:hypothetical protein